MIKKISEFDCIFKNKQSVGNKYFSNFYLLENNKSFKYAISIGKKYGKAHERNLMKRRLRHIIYDLMNDLPNNLKFVIVVKPNSSSLEFADIKKEINYLINKINGKEKEKI